jgi:multidrug efflux pump subunit AcrA (membrane-fusion protein)
MSFKKFFSKKKIIIFIIAAVILTAGGFILARNGGDKAVYVTAKAEKKDLVQTVSEVGTVESAGEAELNFPSPGKLQAKFVKIGDKVKSGQILAELDFQSLSLERDRAESTLKAAQAGLDKLLRGATAAEIAVAQAQAGQAKANYAAANDNLEKTKKTVALDTRQAEKTLSDLQDSGLSTPTTYEQAVITAQAAFANAKAVYGKVIDNSVETLLNDGGGKLAVANTALDNIDKIISDGTIEDYLSAKDKSYLDNTKSTYAEALNLWETANSSLAAAKSDKIRVNIEKASDDILAVEKKVSNSLDYCYGALEKSSISSEILNTHKTNINAQITAVSAAVGVIEADQQALDSAYLSYNSNVSAAENGLNAAAAAYSGAVLSAGNNLASAKAVGDQKISSAQNSAATAKEARDVAERQLEELLSPARAEDLNLYQSKVGEARAALDLAKKQLEDSSLKAPFAGQIVRDNYEIGEQVSSAKPVFAVLAENNFEIIVDISESDIAKIKEGEEVEITLDAFGADQKFSGVVYFIEPASTVIQDVVYYKVKIKFTEGEEKIAAIKAGMTANVVIISARRDGALTAPERAVIEKTGSGKILRVLRNGKIIEEPVKIGLAGDDGLVEILEGNIKEGETIVVFINTSKK